MPDSPAQPEVSAQAAGMRRPQLILLIAVIVVYALLSWYSSGNPAARGLGASLSLGPVLLIGLALLWRWTRPIVALTATALLGAALYRYWPQFKRHFEWADLIQQAGIFGLLAWSFARSLLANRIPLCTQLSDRLHGPLLPEEAAYTRRATLAWSLFYLALTAAIVLLFFTVSPQLWSLFVNFGTYGLIALTFLADHAIRARVLPRRTRSGLLASLRHFLIG